MTIGTRIKHLRQEQNITQEQLAESLGITSCAVSQWECDRTAPDISQLPALANIFNVTTDMLLGVDITRRKEKIDEFIEYNRLNFNVIGDMHGSINYLSGKLKEYPNAPDLIAALAESEYSLYFQSGMELAEDEKKLKAKEIILLCERGIKCTGRDGNTNYFKQLMVYLHSYLGNIEMAQKIAVSMPSIPQTCDMLYPRTLKGKDALKEYQNLLLNLMWLATIAINGIRCNGEYTLDEKIEIMMLKEKLIKLIVGDKLNFYNNVLFYNSMPLSKAYLKKNDKQSALSELEKTLGYAEGYETRPDTNKYEPCWLSETEDHREYTNKHSTKTNYDELMDFLIKSDYFEIFKGNTKFEEIHSKLKTLISDTPPSSAMPPRQKIV
ncbi:MAG: helix-turn-helix transcriptional regulator [Oscillospiraceae bacterium]|nr:helix-turn-helix transcriptional regulator [Oscillospiraceae bacterium]